MGVPITKTVTLVWDGVDWRDQETGVLFEGVRRPYEHGANTLDDTEAWTEDEIRVIVNQAIAERMIPDFPAYFFKANWLVTYDWMRDADQALHTRINELEKKVAQLSKPWWKR